MSESAMPGSGLPSGNATAENAAHPAARSLAGAVRLFESGRLPESETACLELLRSAIACRDDRLRSAAAHLLAAVKRQQGDLTDARRRQAESLASHLRDGCPDDHAGMAAELHGAAADAFLAGDLDAAEDLWRRSLACEIRAGHVAGMASDWGNLGLVALRRGETLRARTCLRQALRLHRRCRHAVGAGGDLAHLAQVWMLEQDWEAAWQCARRSAWWFARGGDMKGCAVQSRLARRIERLRGGAENPRIN